MVDPLPPKPLRWRCTCPQTEDNIGRYGRDPGKIRTYCRACRQARLRSYCPRPAEPAPIERPAPRPVAEVLPLFGACYLCVAPCDGSHWCLGRDDYGENAVCPLCFECHARLRAAEIIWRFSHPPRHLIGQRQGKGATFKIRVAGVR